MSNDARFEDALEGPLALRAFGAEDLSVIAALIQDAVFPVAEMQWDRARRRFAVLLNRFRWERQGAGAPERVQSLLVIEDALAVATQGVERSDKDLILSVLTLEWQPGDDGAGRVVFVLAGDGGIAIEVEALEVTIRDVTKPYLAPSGKAPDHNAV